MSSACGSAIGHSVEIERSIGSYEEIAGVAVIGVPYDDLGESEVTIVAPVARAELIPARLWTGPDHRSQAL